MMIFFNSFRLPLVCHFLDTLWWLVVVFQSLSSKDHVLKVICLGVFLLHPSLLFPMWVFFLFSYLFSFFLSSNLSSWFVHYSFTSRFHHASHLHGFMCKEMMKSVGALWCHGSFSIPYILLLKLSEHQVTIIVETAFQFWFWVMFSLFFRVVVMVLTSSPWMK